VVASVETGSLIGNHLGHKTVWFENYLVKIRKNFSSTSNDRRMEKNPGII
jgi:hypothetical protein